MLLIFLLLWSLICFSPLRQMGYWAEKKIIKGYLLYTKFQFLSSRFLFLYQTIKVQLDLLRVIFLHGTFILILGCLCSSWSTCWTTHSCDCTIFCPLGTLVVSKAEDLKKRKECHFSFDLLNNVTSRSALVSGSSSSHTPRNHPFEDTALHIFIPF